MLLGILLASGLMLSGGEVGEAPRELKLRLVEVINTDRKAAGLDPVEYSDELSKAADAHCREMLEGNYSSHWNREGWKPYLRYSGAGIQDVTSENIHALWSTRFEEGQVWGYMREGHEHFMAEQPPLDGHRRSILEAGHTHVGIGVAFNDRGIRMIELFGARHASLEALPGRASLKDRLIVRGQVLRPTNKVTAIDVYYEELPRPMSRDELRATYSYGLPEERRTERVRVHGGFYSDGSLGSVFVAGQEFQHALTFWKRRPGVYTIVVWVTLPGRRPIPGAMTSVIVEE